MQGGVGGGSGHTASNQSVAGIRAVNIHHPQAWTEAQVRCWERYLRCLWKVATHGDWNMLTSSVELETPGSQHRYLGT